MPFFVFELSSCGLVVCCAVLCCLVFSCIIVSCRVVSWCFVVSCLVLSCLVLSCLVVSCLVMSCHVFSCLVLPCCFVLSSSRVVLCYVALSFSLVSFRSLCCLCVAMPLSYLVFSSADTKEIESATASRKVADLSDAQLKFMTKQEREKVSLYLIPNPNP